MRIDWSCTADIAKLAFKRDDETNEKIVTVTLVALLDADESGDIFGADFVRIAFAAKENRIVTCSQCKPSAVFEAHRVTFANAKPVQSVPVFDKVEPAGAGHVRVWIKLPFVLDDKRLTLALVDSFGDGIAVEVKPEQGELALMPGDVKAEDFDGPAGDEVD